MSNGINKEDGLINSKFQDKIFTVPNILGLFRIICSPIVAWYLLQGKTQLALIILAFAFLTDLFDGYIARKFNQISKLGAILDPVADKLLFSFVIFAVLVRDNLLGWLWFIGLLAFILLIIYLIVHLQFIQLGMKITIMGKVCVFINCFILFFLAAGYTTNLLLIIFTSLIVIPQFLYFYLFYKLKQNAKCEVTI